MTVAAAGAIGYYAARRARQEFMPPAEESRFEGWMLYEPAILIAGLAVLLCLGMR